MLFRGMTTVVLLITGVAAGQSGVKANNVDYRSADQIAAQAKTLLADAQKSPAGLTSVTLEKYPGHMTMLTVRTKSGGAELHRRNNDIFVALDGEADVVTGGTIVDRKDSSPDEVRGTRVEGGTSHVMHKGDVLHISPNVPHQTVVPAGKTFTYYVVKVEEPKS